MSIFELQDDIVESVTASPESGMGFHLVEIDNYLNIPNQKQFIISNSTFVFDFINQINISLLIDIDKFEIKDAELLPIQKLTIQTNLRYNFSGENNEIPPYSYFTKKDEKFIRLSAFRDDKRISSIGEVQAGTYATTPTDMSVTPSGLAAVGRFALPNRQPAVHVFEISPPENTPLYFGTVKPNFGMSGGGVEVFFPKNLPPGSAKYLDQIVDK